MKSEKQPTPRQLRDAMRRLVVAFGTLDHATRPCGKELSVPHAWTLLELLDRAMTTTELSARLNIDRTNVSRLCAKMEEGGDVERRPHPSDGRATLVALTDQGRVAALAVDESSEAHFSRVLDRCDYPTRALLDSLEAMTLALQPVEES